MNFNINRNQGVPPNLQYNMAFQQPFMVGNSNIAPNMNQNHSQLMMMGGVNPGYNGSYPYPPPVMEHQEKVDSTPEKPQDTMSTPGFQPHLVNSNTPNYPNVPSQQVPNINNMQGSYGFHPPMRPQPSVITAPPTVIPQPPMPGMMGNPPLMSPPMMNPPLINNVNTPLMNNNPPVPPMMNFPMKPLIDTLLNPVVVTVPQKDDTPKLANVVYVGGLTTDTTNEFIINMLQKCGKTSHFKRHTDPSSGLLATFAFCDFESPGGAYYAIECLNGLKFGENFLKVSCNSRVKCQIDDWKVGKIEEMCHRNADKSKEEILHMFEDYKVKLKNEFIELITIHFKTMSNGKEGEDDGNNSNAKENQNQGELNAENEGEVQAEASKSTGKEAKDKQPKEEVPVLSKSYNVHRKEMARMHKIRQKKRNYENKYKEQLENWEYEEEKMFKRLKSLQTVSTSKRERLIQEDITGISRPNLKHRPKEIEEDYKDEQEEIDENKSKKISMKIMTSTSNNNNEVDPNRSSKTSRFAKPVENESESTKKQKVGEGTVGSGDGQSAGRVKVVSVFSTDFEEVKKPALTEKQIWKMVPTTDILDFKIDWDLLFSTNLSILIEPWIRRCILEYMGNEDSLINDVLEFIFTRLKERPNPQELLFDVEQFLDEESQGFVTQLWRLLAFHQIRLKNQ